jgi:hypothetical protein
VNPEGTLGIALNDPSGREVLVLAGRRHRSRRTGWQIKIAHMEPRRPPSLGVALPLFLVGMAGIYFFARGIAYMVHGRSTSSGALFLALGLLCYGGGIAVGRWNRRRRSRSAQPGGRE